MPNLFDFLFERDNRNEPPAPRERIQLSPVRRASQPPDRDYSELFTSDDGSAERPRPRLFSFSNPALPIPINGQAPSPFNNGWKEQGRPRLAVQIDPAQQTPVTDLPQRDGTSTEVPLRPLLNDQNRPVDLQGSKRPSESPQQVPPPRIKLTAPPETEMPVRIESSPTETQRLSEYQRLANELNSLNQKDYSKAQYDKDGNLIKGAGKDRDTDWSWKEKLGGFFSGLLDGVASGRGILGGLPEAIGNATDRNWLEKKNDLNRRIKLQPQLQAAQQQEKFNAEQLYKNAQINSELQEPLLKSAELRRKIADDERNYTLKVEQEKAKAKARGEEWDTYIDENTGKVFKQFKNDPTRQLEALTDPDTGAQLTSPSKQVYDYYDPITKQTVKATAGQIVGASATIQGGNASREQTTRQFNATKQFEVDKQNIDNQLEYQKQVNTALSTLGSTEGELSALGSEVAGLRGSIDANRSEAAKILTRINEINASITGDSNDDQIKQANAEKKTLNTRYNSLIDSHNKSTQKLYEPLGKTDAGRMKLETIRNAMPKAPQKLSFTPIKAVQVSGGQGRYSGMSFTLDNTLRSRFPNRSDAEIRQIIQAQGGQVR